MATVIDALIVTLGLDSSKFKQGTKEVGEGLKDTRNKADQAAKDMEAAGKRAASFFGSIRTELLALVGVTLSAAGVKTFITSMTNDLMRLGIESKALDMSAKSLEGWERAAAAAGSTAERMSTTLGTFQRALTNYRTGGAQDDPMFGALANFGSATGANFNFDKDNSEAIMRKIAQNWNKLSEDAKRRFGSMFGFDNAMQQGLSSGQLVADANHFTSISKATDEATKKALDFNRRLQEMKQNFSAAAQVLYEALIPYIEKLIPVIEKIGIWIANHGPEIERFFTNAATKANELADAVGGWENVLKGLLVFVAGRWLAGILGALGGVRLALTGLARLSLIAGLVELQKYAEKIEQKYAWLKSNPVTDTLNTLPGSGAVDEAGKATSRWMRENLGFGFRDDDGYGTPEATTASSEGGQSQPRGIRNNNPGNLNYAGQAGASKESGPNGRFAVFQSMTHGVAALYKQLQLYFKRGVNTLSSIVSKYAPESDGNNVGAYIAALSGATGLGANDSIKAGDTATIAKLIKGIVDHENGKGYVSSQEIMGGIQLGSGGMMARNYQQQAGPKTDIHIGEMTVQSSATSVDALGADVQRSMQRNRLINPAMSGQG